MKQIILLSFFSGIVLFNNHSYGQITTPFNDVKSMHKEEWTPHFSNDDFSIEYKFIACDPEMGYDQESVLLKIKNNTSSHLSISWHMILHYDELCRTCDFEDEYTFTFDLEPNAEKSSDCSVYSNNQLKIFSRFIDQNYTNGEVLTGFQFEKLDWNTKQ